MKYNRFLLNFKWLTISLILLLLLTQCSSDDSISFSTPNAGLSINETVAFDSNIDNVEQIFLNGFNESGKMVFVSNRENGANIFIMDFDNKMLTQITDDSNYSLGPKWSPDGTKILYASSVGEEANDNVEIFIYDLIEQKRTQLTSNNVYDGMASWSPKEDKVVFVSNRDDDTEIYIMDVQNGSVSRITNNAGIDLGPDWSPDGERIVFASSQSLPNGEASGLPTDLYLMNIDGSEVVRLTEFMGALGSDWSPDGKYIAFSSGIRNSRISVLNVETGEINFLLDNATYPYESFDISEKSPIWLPNSKNIIFTLSARFYGEQIYMTSIEFDEERVLIPLTTGNYSNLQPDWFGQ